MHLATDIYHNDPKFLCWQTMSKRADQDHTEQSDQDLKCLPGHLHLLNTILYGKKYVLQSLGYLHHFTIFKIFRSFSVHVISKTTCMV